MILFHFLFSSSELRFYQHFLVFYNSLLNKIWRSSRCLAPSTLPRVIICLLQVAVIKHTQMAILHRGKPFSTMDITDPIRSSVSAPLNRGVSFPLALLLSKTPVLRSPLISLASASVFPLEPSFPPSLNESYESWYYTVQANTIMWYPDPCNCFSWCWICSKLPVLPHLQIFFSSSSLWPNTPGLFCDILFQSATHVHMYIVILGTWLCYRSYTSSINRLQPGLKYFQFQCFN